MKRPRVQLSPVWCVLERTRSEERLVTVRDRPANQKNSSNLLDRWVPVMDCCYYSQRIVTSDVVF